MVDLTDDDLLFRICTIDNVMAWIFENWERVTISWKCLFIFNDGSIFCFICDDSSSIIICTGDLCMISTLFIDSEELKL